MQLKPGSSDLTDESEATSESDKEDEIFNTISNVFKSNNNPLQNTAFNSPKNTELEQVGERTHFCKLSSDLDEIISNRPGTSDSGISTFKPTSLKVYDDENESFNSESSSERRNLSSSEDSSLKTFSSSSSSSSLKRNKHLGIRKRRRQCNKVRQKWTKTAEILQQSGLLDITIKTADLMRQNQQIQKEIELLQQETNKFVMSVLNNPENKHILNEIHSYSQLCEIIVPGSQLLMATNPVVPEEKKT